MKPYRYFILSTTTLLFLLACHEKSQGVSPTERVWTEGIQTAPITTPEEVTKGQQVFVQLAEKLLPTVVNINTEERVQTRPMMPQFGGDEFFHKFFEDFFEPFDIPREQIQKNLGSGFIINEDGYILTNAHVVARADEISVKLSEESKQVYKAKLIGTDSSTDIAILKIDVKENGKKVKLPVAPLGNSDQLKVGEWVLAIGHPFGHGHTVTAGIVSAKERILGEGLEHPYNNYIQTDASINPGNSGGPLINTRGEVIGISVATDVRAMGIIGFAIPVNVAKQIIPQLIAQGHATRGYIGIKWAPLSPELAKHFNLKEDQVGIVVAEVFPGEPADRAGIQPYDIITEFDGKQISTPRDLLARVGETPVGKEVTIKGIRVKQGGKPKDFSVNLKISERKIDIAQKEKPKNPKKEEVDLGLLVAPLPPQADTSYGILITQTDRGGIAFQAGLRNGDIILEINQIKIRSVNQFEGIVSEFSRGQSHLFRIKREEYTDLVLLRIPKESS